MATRSPRDRPQNSTPSKITPRQTAASAARAARNVAAAAGAPRQRASPGRTPSSPNKTKQTCGQRYTHKGESKSEERCRDLPHEDSNGQNDKTGVHGTELEPITGEKTWASNTIVIASASEEMKMNAEISMHEIPIEEKGDVPTRRPRTPVDDTQTAKSRPATPRAASRPQTPAHPAAQRSRPPTAHGRPPTPADAQPSATSAQRISSSRSPAHISTSHGLVGDDEAAILKSDSETLRSVYDSRQKQFNQMKKELDIKQQNVLKAYDQLHSLHERLALDGAADPGSIPQDLVILNVTDWAAGEIAQWYRGSQTIEEVEEILNNPPPLDESILKDMSARMNEIPTRFADLCLQAFTARQDIIDWVKELLTHTENGSGEALDRIAKLNTQGFDLCEALRDLKGRADDVVTTVVKLSKRMCHERCALMAAGESLVREVAALRADFDARAADAEADPSNSKGLEELRRELEDERKSKAALRDKLAATETQFKAMRTRVAKMDKQLNESSATIASLTSTVKALEDQNRQRELQLEARARKLRESLKTGEMASNEFQQQRNTLQNELQEVKEQLTNVTSKHKSTVKELSEQIKDLKSALEETRRETHHELEKRMETERALNESQKHVEELQEQIAQIEKRLPNPDMPTQREINLWAELQSTKETLRLTEDEITFFKKEKIRFLETLTKITDSENKVGMQQKLAAELLNKEELLGNMQNQIKELKKNIKYSEEKVIQYEKYVHELHSHNAALVQRNDAPDGSGYQELHQQVMGLRMKLLDAAQRNEELSEALAQKEQDLEQQDKTSRAQARVIKVLTMIMYARELIAMLKNKETEQAQQLAALQKDIEHRMKIVDDVNKQIAAKANEIQDLFATLESKQQQIRRLEKIILALEDQQRRAQAQRTRHEEKIAALEHELAAFSNKRKFLFF